MCGRIVDCDSAVMNRSDSRDATTADRAAVAATVVRRPPTAPPQPSQKSFATGLEGGCAMSHSLLTDVRSEALFASPLQQADDPTPAEIRAAVTAAVRTFGSRGCAARMAQEFGDHPDTAMSRMSWARRLVSDVYAAHVPAARPEVMRSGRAGATATAVARAA
jgi:hypothetical protein